jgi:hypothetical protein
MVTDRRIMNDRPIYRGYYDAGGCERHGHTLVAVGVVATVDQWDVFDLRWLDVLRRCKISSFHMAKIAQWKGDVGQWPLKDGQRDEDRRKEMFVELVKVASVVRKVFVRGIVLADYEAMESRYRIGELLGGPYSVAQLACLIQSWEWVRTQSDPPPPFQAIVEAGDAGQDRFRRMCEKYLGWVPAFEGKKAPSGEDITPLSLADLIAYEHNNLYNKRAAGLPVPSREKWRGLTRAVKESLPVDARVIEAGWLEWLARRRGGLLRAVGDRVFIDAARSFSRSATASAVARPGCPQ